MAVAWPHGFEIDFVRNPFSGSAAWFLFLNQNSWKHPWHQNNFIVKARFSIFRFSLRSGFEQYMTSLKQPLKNFYFLKFRNFNLRSLMRHSRKNNVYDFLFYLGGKNRLSNSRGLILLLIGLSRFDWSKIISVFFQLNFLMDWTCKWLETVKMSKYSWL